MVRERREAVGLERGNGLRRGGRSVDEVRRTLGT